MYFVCVSVHVCISVSVCVCLVCLSLCLCSVVVIDKVNQRVPHVNVNQCRNVYGNKHSKQ